MRLLLLLLVVPLTTLQAAPVELPPTKASAATAKSSLAFPYMATSEGREGYEFAGEETNTYRVYDFYKRQAKHHLQADTDLALLPAYPDLDGGTFGHWGNYNENGHKDLRWNDMDYGPALAATYSIDKKKEIGGMLSLLLPSGHTVTFDREQGGYYNAWEGRPYFNPHRWGLIHGVAVPDGVEATNLSTQFGAISVDGKTMSRYLGHYLHGKRVMMHYEIGQTRFFDSVSRMKNGCYVRSLSASQAVAVTFPFTLETTDNVVVAVRAYSNGESALLTSTNAATGDAFKVYYWEGAASEVDAVVEAIKADTQLDPLQKWTKGGKPNWPQTFTEPVTQAKDDRAYVIDRIGVPFENPWGSMMLLSGIDFDKDGVTYVTTLMGDVWKVSGLGEGMTEATWKRFATGLNQPFGLRIIDGLPYVLTRNSIVCLQDLNGDAEADYYQNYHSFAAAPTAHTHTFGFHVDKDRTFYFVNGPGAYKKPWNKPAELLASGLRNAMAVGANRDGLFLVGPQEGIWTPSSAVLEIQHDDYYGMGPKQTGTKQVRGTAEITPAMAYLPRGIDNSTGGFEFPDSDRFGPLNGKTVGLSYGYGSWFEILRNANYADYGRAQGAIVPLPGEFRAGVLRGAMHPGDGQFYVIGTDGWGNYALDDGSLERVRYTGKPMPRLEGVHGYENGIELQFSAKLRGNAADAKHYFVQQWNYEYSPAYGSLEFSVRQPAKEGHDRVRVTGAKLLPDGKSVFLEIPDLLPAMQTHIYAALDSVEVNTFATFIHLDKAKPGFAAPVPAKKSRTASLRTRSQKVGNERVAGNVANTPEGRIRAGETLFKAYCTGCHGPQGQGLPNIAPTLHSDWVAGDREVLTKVLLHGLTGDIRINGMVQHFEAPMPAFGAALGDDEIAAILSFIRKTWSDAKTDVPKGLVQKVRASEKARTTPYDAQALWQAAAATPKAAVAQNATAPASAKPIHLFILSGQSNMAGMDPETGFMPEAKKLFKDETVVYLKVAKGGQPICRWLEEWADIAEKNGMDARSRQRILKGEGVLFYQPILDQYQEILKTHPSPTSVTFCWMQGERDANGGAHAAYKDALPQLIAKLRRDLKRPDMNIVIGRISDAALDRPAWTTIRKAQREIADEDPRGAWVDVDDLNDKEVNGKMQSVVHYSKAGYVTLGKRFARQGHALIKGKEPAKDGRP